MQESVVLLHGILLTARSMRPLEKCLKKAGYRVLNLTYPSRHYELEELAERIHPAIAPFIASAEGPVHFIGHSMGGLLIRTYLDRYPTPKRGRVVMLGTPNHGSEVADFLRRNWLYRRLFGPAGQQLCTGSTYKPLGAGDAGVIAGDFCWNPLSARMIGKPNDGQVSVASSRLDTPHEHVVLRAAHTLMPRNKRIHAQVLQFLKTGKFLA